MFANIFAGKKRIGIIGGAIAVLIAVVAGGVYWYQQTNTVTASERAAVVRQVENLTIQQKYDQVEKVLTDYTSRRMSREYRADADMRMLRNYLFLHNCTKVIEWGKKVQQVDAKNVSASLNIAKCEVGLGHNTLAIAAYKHTIELAKQNKDIGNIPFIPGWEAEIKQLEAAGNNPISQEPHADNGQPLTIDPKVIQSAKTVGTKK